MRSGRRSAIFIFAIMAATALPPSPAAALGPDRASGDRAAPARGCWYYRDSEFRGASAEIVDGQEVRSLGDDWNDQISSITCHSACTLLVYENADYGGLQRRIAGDVRNIGDAWNDKISSMKATCRRRVRGIE